MTPEEYELGLKAFRILGKSHPEEIGLQDIQDIQAAVVLVKDACIRKRELASTLSIAVSACKGIVDIFEPDVRHLVVEGLLHVVRDSERLDLEARLINSFVELEKLAKKSEEKK